MTQGNLSMEEFMHLLCGSKTVCSVSVRYVMPDTHMGFNACDRLEDNTSHPCVSIYHPLAVTSSHPKFVFVQSVA